MTGKHIADASKMVETITWNSPDDPPDADITVLINVPNACEPAWPGYWDGEDWRWADQSVADGVVAWADMPKGVKSDAEG